MLLVEAILTEYTQNILILLRSCYSHLGRRRSSIATAETSYCGLEYYQRMIALANSIEWANEASSCGPVLFCTRQDCCTVNGPEHYNGTKQIIMSILGSVWKECTRILIIFPIPSHEDLKSRGQKAKSDIEKKEESEPDNRGLLIPDWVHKPRRNCRDKKDNFFGIYEECDVCAQW